MGSKGGMDIVSFAIAFGLFAALFYFCCRVKKPNPNRQGSAAVITAGNTSVITSGGMRGTTVMIRQSMQTARQNMEAAQAQAHAQAVSRPVCPLPTGYGGYQPEVPGRGGLMPGQAYPVFDPGFWRAPTPILGQSQGHGSAPAFPIDEDKPPSYEEAMRQ